MPSPPLDYPVQLGIAYLFLAGYFFRTLFVNLRLPGSVGVIVSGFIYSFFFQEDLFWARDKLQSLAFFLVLLTAGLEIKFQDLKLHVFLLAMAPSSLEVLAISVYSMFILEFSLMEGLVLGSVLVALGDGLVIPKMKEFGEAFPDHPMPRLVFTWAPVEASFILAVFGILGGLAHPEDEPEIEPSVLVFANVFRIGATLAAAACMGGTCAWLISRRRKSMLDFTGLPVEAFLMVLATALFAFGLGQESEVSTPVPLGFSPGSAFQPELLVILTGSFFAAFCEPHVLHDVEKILGGVWIFGQLVLFTMLGSKTSLDLFGKVTSVLPMMVVGLTARFLGILLVMASTCEGRRRGREDILNDTIFGFLSMLPRATIQGALGAVPEARRFFSDQGSNRDHARAFIFDAARLYIVLMSVGGMVMLNTFGYKMLECASKDRLSESGTESEATQESAEVIRSVALLAKLYDLSNSHVQDLVEDLMLQDAKRTPAEEKVMYEVRLLLEERNALFEAEQVLLKALQCWDEDRRKIVLASREARMFRQRMCFFNRIGLLCREDRSDPTVWQTIDQGTRQVSSFKVSNTWPEQPVLNYFAKASLPAGLSKIMLALNELSLWDEWCAEARLKHVGGGSSRSRHVHLTAALEEETLDFDMEVQRFDDPSSGLVAEHLEGRSLQHDGAVLAIIRNIWVACGHDYTVLVQFGGVSLQKGLAKNDLLKSSDLHRGFRVFIANLAAVTAKVQDGSVEAEPWLKARKNHTDTLYQCMDSCEASAASQGRWSRAEEEVNMASPRTPRTPFSRAMTDEISVKMEKSSRSPRVSHVASTSSPMRARASTSRSATLPDDVSAGTRELRAVMRCFEVSELEPVFRREPDELNESEEQVYAVEQAALVEATAPPALPKHRSAKHLRIKRSMRAWRRREDPLADFERVRSSSTASDTVAPSAPRGRRNSV